MPGYKNLSQHLPVRGIKIFSTTKRQINNQTKNNQIKEIYNLSCYHIDKFYGIYPGYFVLLENAAKMT